MLKNNFLVISLVCAGLMMVSSAQADVPVVDAAQYEANTTNVSDSNVNTAEPEQTQQQPIASYQPAPQIQHLSLEQRVAKLEQQIANQNQMDMPTQINTMQQAIQMLRGRIDVAAHDLKSMQQQLQSMYQDLDSRIARQKGLSDRPSVVSPAALGSAVAPTAEGATGSTNKAEHTPDKPGSNSKTTTDQPVPPLPSTNAQAKSTTVATNAKTIALGAGTPFLQDQDSYLVGYNNIKNHEYTKAIAAMQNYLLRFPKGQYAVNAHFWLGELYLINNDNKKAINEFETVVQAYPNDVKVPDAKLKIGFIYFDNGQKDLAKNQLLAVKKEYPGTTVAQLATARLRDLGK